MPAKKTIEVDREKLVSIIHKTLELPFQQEVFMPSASKKEQQDLHTCLIRELKALSSIDPEASASITHRAIFRDGRYWLVLTHVEPALNAIFIKDKEGNLTKVTL